ncbi:MAG: hypothetical protein ABI609_17640, partial [Acidobacteriota bacterium]
MASIKKTLAVLGMGAAFAAGWLASGRLGGGQPLDEAVRAPLRVKRGGDLDQETTRLLSAAA